MATPKPLSGAVRFGALLLLLLAGPSAPAAVSVGPSDSVQVGGFFSQGYLVNDGPNNYLGETSDGTADFREYAVSASWAKGKWRIGAQGFGQKLGEYGDDEMKLDWAVVDYQASQWFGVRAGRVKMPRGLYNEALDVDAVRPFVLLPQSVYDARLRDFNAAFNGGMLYGNIGLGRAGTVDYRAFYGEIPMSIESGASDYFNNDIPFPNVAIGMDSAHGGTVFWNTPATGLRVGYSYSGFRDFTALRVVVVPGFSATLYKSAPTYHRHLASVEYTTGDWTFAAEAGIEKATYDIGIPGLPPTNRLDFEADYFYVSAARRMKSWLELGAYVSYSHERSTLRTSAAVTIPSLVQADYALSARFDVNENVLFKVEAHYMDGSGKLFDTPRARQPVAGRDNSWLLFAAKTTLSF